MKTDFIGGYDFIADLHGDLDRAYFILDRLGYDLKNMTHPEGRRAFFLGDYIDRGADGLGVLELVAEMRAKGLAQAIMGNHELNALMFHTDDKDGNGLRKRDSGNTDQHEAFLRQCPLGSYEADRALKIMLSLPLVVMGYGFRAVHAYWSDKRVADLLAERPDGRISKADLWLAKDEYDTALGGAITELTKGPEFRLQDGAFYFDRHGSKRKKARVKWWSAGEDLHSSVTSLPDFEHIPNGPVPDEVTQHIYRSEAPPVFFGHYQLPEAHIGENTVCLDTPKTPVAWRWNGPQDRGFFFDPERDIEETARFQFA